MDGHGTLSASGALKTDVVFKIFTHQFEHLEIFIRKILCLYIGLRFLLRLGQLGDLLLKLSYGKTFLDDEIAEVFLNLEVLHAKVLLGMSYT